MLPNYNYKNAFKCEKCPKSNGEESRKCLCGKELNSFQKKYCSKSCAVSFRWKNPEFKSKMSKIISKQMVNQWQKSEWRTKITEEVLSKHYFKSEFISNRNKVNWQNSEYRKTRTEQVIKQHTYPEFRKIISECGRKTWKANSLYRNGGIYKSEKAGEIQYLSSWELEAYKLLDKKLEVMTYKVEPLHIKYIDYKGKYRNYWPDILIFYKDNSKELIEIKPVCHLADDNNIIKFLAAVDYCKENNMKFKIWTEINWPEVSYVY
jgi:hypothetical protein